MPYLTLFIKESLRIHPPVPEITRQIDQPITVEGVTLEPGTQFAISIYCLHHNPAVWGDDHNVSTLLSVMYMFEWSKYRPIRLFHIKYTI